MLVTVKTDPLNAHQVLPATAAGVMLLKIHLVMEPLPLLLVELIEKEDTTITFTDVSPNLTLILQKLTPPTGKLKVINLPELPLG